MFCQDLIKTNNQNEFAKSTIQVGDVVLFTITEYFSQNERFIVNTLIKIAGHCCVSVCKYMLAEQMKETKKKTWKKRIAFAYIFISMFLCFAACSSLKCAYFLRNNFLLLLGRSIGQWPNKQTGEKMWFAIMLQILMKISHYSFHFNAHDDTVGNTELNDYECQKRHEERTRSIHVNYFPKNAIKHRNCV